MAADNTKNHTQNTAPTAHPYSQRMLRDRLGCIQDADQITFSSAGGDPDRFEVDCSRIIPRILNSMLQDCQWTFIRDYWIQPQR